MPRKPRRTPVEIRDDAKARWETHIYNSRLNKAKNTINAKYDVVDNNNSEKRRIARIETTDEEGILKPYDRLNMINLCRDVERNSTSAKGLLKQFKVNVIGNLAKMQMNTEDDEVNRMVNDWFNKIWANDCDSRSDATFNEQLKLTLTAVIREGDCLIVFDDVDNDDGKMLYYEADQLVTVDELTWKSQTDWTEEVTVNGRKETIPLQQSNGVVYTKKGKVIAYIVTCKHGQTTANYKDVTVFRRGVAKLIKSSYRHNQLRGTGEFFAVVQDILDIYEMRCKELQTAKLAATYGGTITKTDGAEEAIFRGGVAPESLLEADDNTAEATTAIANYDNLENLVGGALEYLIPGEEFNELKIDRPNVHIQEFFDYVLQNAGAGLGLAKSYAKMEAYNSYTAFRGEMLLSWVTFYDWQKFLENHVCDWVAAKAIQWAIDNNKLNVKLPIGWQGMISWVFPKMPQVDPVKDNTARRDSMKDGFIDFSAILGPDWKQKLKATADGLSYARELGIPLTAFESKSGALIEDTGKNNDDSDDDSDEDKQE